MLEPIIPTSTPTANSIPAGARTSPDDGHLAEQTIAGSGEADRPPATADRTRAADTDEAAHSSVAEISNVPTANASTCAAPLRVGDGTADTVPSAAAGTENHSRDRQYRRSDSAARSARTHDVLECARPPGDKQCRHGESTPCASLLQSAPSSVWATAQQPSRDQRRGRYIPESVYHPGKMLPAIAAHAIAVYTSAGDIVADPMCGIGTTLVEAVHAGRRAVGVEYEQRWADLAEAEPPPRRGQRRHREPGRWVSAAARPCPTFSRPTCTARSRW